MNRRIKKKLGKRDGYFHYRDYKNAVAMNSSWQWGSENHYGGNWTQEAYAKYFTTTGFPRHIYIGNPLGWNIGIPFSGMGLC